MIGMQVTTRSDIPKVIRRAQKENITRLGHAAAIIRITARRSIRKSRRPAREGSPPHTRTKRLPNSILYFVDKSNEMALIGTDHNRIGVAGAEHEHNVAWRKPALGSRPFMAPALAKTSPRLPQEWRGFVG